MTSTNYRLIAILALFVFGGVVVAKVYPNYQKPCRHPIEYSLGSFDDSFKISQSRFLQSIAEAEQVWEAAINQQLFEYSSSQGELKINLVYDYRQEATDKLKRLGYKIETTQSSYNNLKARYDTQTQSYSEKKTALDLKVAQFETRKQAYEDKVQYWNTHGGASKQETVRLNAEYQTLIALASQINLEKDSLNSLVEEINALVNILNSLAAQLNLNVSSYNTIGQSRGGEFEEGVYVKDSSGISINIYEFSDEKQLFRLLAHELGHALGLEHLDNPEAIMYRLNQGQNEKLTEDDLTELKRLCRISP